MKNATIHTADLAWQTDDNGVTVPFSPAFNDVYFSTANGLAEARHVFIEGNDLPQRLANLSDYQRFTIGEIGFGTGLNVLAIWQLWQKVKQNNHSHLHIITTEKFPLTKADLTQALSVWQELGEFSQKLIENYPPPLAGCHRLNFFADNFTLDIWLGDAGDSLSQIFGKAKIDAWLLGGFAPSHNAELWSANLFSQLARLSKVGSTLATYSVANVVKTGLKSHGFDLQKRQGFGKKREMLTAKFNLQNLDKGHMQYAPTKNHNFSQLKFKPLKPTKLIHYKKTRSHLAKPPFSLFFARKKVVIFANPRGNLTKNPLNKFSLPDLPLPNELLNIAIIGAGVAGLATAWALAQQGHWVTIFDKVAPLVGASGNPRAVFAPKLTSLARLPSNLHAIGYLAGLQFYRAISQQTGIEILETTQALDLLAFNRITAEDVGEFSPEFVALVNGELGEAIFVPQAGLIDTANFAKAILSHKNIAFQQGELQNYQQIGEKVVVNLNPPQSLFGKGGLLPSFIKEGQGMDYDHLILCTALETCDFLPQINRFNYSRGQVSWFAVNDKIYHNLPNATLKYGGYCAKFQQNGEKRIMLGASFVRDTLDTTPTESEHASNLAEFTNALPVLAKNLQFPSINDWHGRVGIRCQTVDYLPLVGQVGEPDSRIWTFSALGSKGYCYAPIGSELLAGLISGEVLPLPKIMVEKLSPNRRVIQA